jgi:hypothetical protein
MIPCNGDYKIKCFTCILLIFQSQIEEMVENCIFVIHITRNIKFVYFCIFAD